MENEVRLIIFGLGSIGKLIARSIVEKKGIRIVGAVDIAKDLVGKDLGEVLELCRNLGVTVTDDAKELFSRIKADIAVIATSSYLKDVYPLVALCVEAGINVISLCEELSYPYYKYPELSCKIDELAKKYHVAVLGTGINPGYLMDTLPIVLTGPCQRIESIKVTRVVDPSRRRVTYQKKLGIGLSPEEFRKMVEERKITGLIGLVEPMAMIAAALGWKLEEIKEFPLEPIIAEKEMITSFTLVKPGCVAGLKSVTHGIKNGKPVLVMEFILHIAVEEEYDAVLIEGIPTIYERIAGGINGDIGTVAMIINMIPKVLNSRPGLVTMKDLPLPSAVTEDLRLYLSRNRP